jgi:hypothetical protein
MKKVNCLWVIFVLLGGCATAQQESFLIGKKIGDGLEITLDSMEIFDKKTYVDLLFHNVKSVPTSIIIAPPKDEGAFVLQDAQYGTLSEDIYPLLEVLGVNTGQYTTIEGNEKKFVRLVFERVQTQHFNLIEGAGNENSSDHWNFIDVKLYEKQMPIRIHATRRMR